MKFTVTLHEGGEREKLVLESGTDLPKHIALKLLAYVLYRRQTDGLPLEIERAVGQRHKPDLVTTDPLTGQIRLWIDCGQIEPERLGRIVAKNPNAEVVVVKGEAREAERYAEAARKDLSRPARVVGFAAGFIEAFVDELWGTNTLEILQREPRLELVFNGTALQTDVTTY